ncbi:MAG: hypothetical protein UW30_C0011G0005 [Candidatus Giovannonibacteria bacterium GW2011_GWA2_44_13b]|uniref:VTT domain-containing protein n=2 Tax=Candidatus Giovannoniibacteriota TaxID=1752738 RepID=A0A0G1K0A5_9BACT|nr:MAG: hypothetical protein UW30_C0011G0005 [Candidatus Giovannonibacteria bacterium GW2011_GWA2_44_13b]OGF82066.1 MAG: hypothetical protein A2924_01875 [Candidatus Giovannonibacteria bacterium RIFCSPLOWO2_01_FULL_44_16]
MPQKQKNYLIGSVSVLFFAGLSVYLFLYSSPGKLIGWIGVENAYVLIFVTAIFGGFTTFNIIPYHLLLITLASGGLNPFLLGFLAATGVTIGDSTSFFVGRQGRAMLSERIGKWFAKLNRVALESPNLFMVLCFFYSALMPMSNDFITIPAGLARLPFWKTMLPLVFGNIVFDISLALLAAHAFDIFKVFELISF